MTKVKIQLPEILKKHVKLVGYLLVSGLLGWLLAYYVLDNDQLSLIFAPAINYILYALKKELDKEGIIQTLKK